MLAAIEGQTNPFITIIEGEWVLCNYPTTANITELKKHCN